jgi:hypothetical protein
MTNSSPVISENTPTLTQVATTALWRSGALFAVSLVLIVSGAVVLLMMCLFRLADLSEKWDGDALGQLLLLRGRMAQAMNREFQPGSESDLLRLPNASLYGSNFSNVAFSNWRISQRSHPNDNIRNQKPRFYSSVDEQ